MVCLLWAVLSLFPVVLVAQDVPDTPADAAELQKAEAERDSGAGDISELTDEEAARKAEAARREAERTQREAESKRQQAEQAEQQADRVRDIEERVESEAVEGPPEPVDQQRQEAVKSAREAAEQEAVEQAKAAEQAEKEHKQSSAEAEVLEKAADPETGAIYRALHDREGGPILGIRFNAQLAIDGAKYESGSALAADDGFDVRRARVGLYKGWGANWYGKLTLEISSGEFQARDNYLGYNGWSTALLQFGIFSEPFSQESMTSFKYTTFMEQAMPVDAMAPGHSLGVAATKRTNAGILTGGIFLKRPEQEGNIGEDGQAITLRFVRSPMWRPEAQNTHFGISGSYRVNATTQGTRYRARPESAVTEIRFVDTDFIEGADRILRLGADLSRLWGPKSLQAEVIALKVQRDGERPDVVFAGAYVFGSWFLTGETRNYREGAGVYGQIRPLAPLGGGGKGALELTARASYLDLTDEDIVGGTESNITAGVNWYPKDGWRFTANLIKVLDVKRPGNEFDGQNPWIFTIRGQYEWN